MSAKLMDYFNKTPRLGTLSTANRAGRVNVAYFGSPRMIDEKTIFMGCGKNRTFANLQENPKAVFMIMEPGNSPPEWKGVRLYLRMTECETLGKKLEMLKTQIAEKAGPAAAKMMHAAITFEIEELRPVADFGQSWEKSIQG
jgi:hypothetical protein